MNQGASTSQNNCAEKQKHHLSRWVNIPEQWVNIKQNGGSTWIRIYIRVDNGPEFTSHTFVNWCKKESIIIKYIQPGRPMQNGYIERLNRSYREDVLDAYLLESLEQARITSDEWQYAYNHLLPHDSLNKRTPVMMRESLPAATHLKHMIEHEHKVSDQQQNKQSYVLNE